MSNASFEDFLVLYERNGGFQQIRISGTDGLSDAWNIPFPEPVYNFLPMRNPEYKTKILRFTYTSPVTPNSLIDYNVKEKSWTVVKQEEIPSGYDSSQYVSERAYATASDGTGIPMSLVYKTGLEKNGDNPALLYGNGSYGYSLDPGCNANLISLLDRGFVLAIGDIRGGSEMGRAWYENGRMLHKRNTFTDFIACAGRLARQPLEALLPVAQPLIPPSISPLDRWRYMKMTSTIGGKISTVPIAETSPQPIVYSPISSAAWNTRLRRRAGSVRMPCATS